jgi:hypothetical protein
VSVQEADEKMYTLTGNQRMLSWTVMRPSALNSINTRFSHTINALHSYLIEIFRATLN